MCINCAQIYYLSLSSFALSVFFVCINMCSDVIIIWYVCRIAFLIGLTLDGWSGIAVHVGPIVLILTPSGRMLVQTTGIRVTC